MKKVRTYCIFLLTLGQFGILSAGQIDTLELKTRLAKSNTASDSINVLLNASANTKFLKNTPKTPHELDKNRVWLSSYKELSDYAENNLPPRKLATYRYHHFVLNYLLHQNKDALPIGERLISTDIFETTTHKFNTYFWLATSYKNLGLHSRFIELFLMLKTLPGSKGDFFNTYERCDMMAQSLYLTGNYQEARNYYHKAGSCLSRPKNRLVTVFNNIGLTFSKEGIIDSAVYYFDKAEILANGIIEHSPALIWKHMLAVINSNRAKLLHEEKLLSIDDLIHILEKELSEALALNDYRPIYGTMTQLAEYNYLAGKMSAAKSYLDNRKNYQKHKLSSKTYLTGMLLEAKIALNQGNKKYADSLFKAHQLLEDSVEHFINQPRTELTALSARNRNNKQALELTSTQLKNSKQQVAFERSRRAWLVGGIAAICLVALVLFLLLKRLRKQRNAIHNKNQIIQASLEQKEILLKEIHHRVKNNLQVVSGLIQSQAMRTDSHEIRRMMRATQDRIKSMAIIHQKLYQTTDFSSIEPGEYIRELSNTIASTYNPQNKKIQTHLSVETIPLDIDTAVPLGLIINELLTNCYKYAFRGKENGEVYISLNYDDKEITLTVRDNGIGFPEAINFQNTKTLGLTLIRGLTNQLRGQLSFDTDHTGTSINLTFNQNTTK